MVMVANQTGTVFGFLAGRYPGGIGHLYSPGAQEGPFPFFPYALDNGAYPLWAMHGRRWDFQAHQDWLALLRWAARKPQRPLWAIVPDSVADRDGTLAMWREHEPTVRAFGFRPAFAVQDGMTFADVPAADCMLFLGGSTDWKEAAIGPWCAQFPGRVHVGRVNRKSRLRACHEAGAVSVDGTGWYHDKNGQRAELIDFLERVHGRKAA